MTGGARYLVLALSVAALAGCMKTQGTAPDGPPQGEAVTNNIAYMTGEKRYVVDLAERFANEVPSMVNFAFNSARLDPAARQILRRQADWIRQFPEVRFRVYGHTDAVGTNAYNKRLGLRRANAVVNYLSRLGIGRNRLQAVVSFGETQSLVVTQGRERRNRRTVTEVSGFLQTHPIIMDGKYAEVVQREYVKSAKPDSDLMLVKKDSGSASSGSKSAN